MRAMPIFFKSLGQIRPTRPLRPSRSEIVLKWGPPFGKGGLGGIFENSDVQQAHETPLTPLPIGEAK